MNHHDPLVRPATWAVDGMWWVYSTCVFQHGEVMIWTCRKTPGWSCGGQGGLSFTKKIRQLWNQESLQKKKHVKQKYRWWCQAFFMFIPIWGNDPIWLIFFKWVEALTSSESWQLQHNTKVDDVYARRLRNLCMRRCHLLREQPKAPLRRAQWWRYWDATVIKWVTKKNWLVGLNIGDYTTYTTQLYRGYNKPL